MPEHIHSSVEYIHGRYKSSLNAQVLDSFLGFFIDMGLLDAGRVVNEGKFLEGSHC